MNKHEIEKQIRELKDYAKSKGLSVRFRNRKTDQGDFCIFIYDKNFRKSYAVGFDGSWDDPVYFDQCLSMAYDWIANRDDRFVLVEGKWFYKRFLLTTTDGSCNDYFISFNEAKKTARIYEEEHLDTHLIDTGTDGNKNILIW